MNKHILIKKPNFFIYFFIGGLVVLWAKLRYHFKVDKSDFKMPKENFVVVANHTSFLDFIFLAAVLFPRRINFVVARKFFQTKFLGGLLKALGGIPKNLFEADLEATRKMLEVSKIGGNLAVYPEGQISATGVTNLPMGSIGKLIKKMDMTVISARSYGVYFVAPPWGKQKSGEITIKLSNVLSRNEIESLGIESINLAVYNGIFVDNAKFAETLETGYTGKDFAVGLHNMFFICPQCAQWYTLDSSEDRVKCTKCGAEFKLDEKMRLDIGNEKYSIYRLYKKQEQEFLKGLDENFEFHDDCILRKIERNTEVAIIKGVVVLNKNWLKFFDENNNCLFSMNSDKRMYAPYQIGEDFQVTYDNVCYYFQVEGNRNLKYVLALERMYKTKNC